MGKKKKVAPEVRVTVAKFDSVDPFAVVRDAEPISEFRKLTTEDYAPRGGTPLRDATARFLTHIDDQRKPGRVVVGVLADESGSMSMNREAVIDSVNEFVGGLSDVKKVGADAAGTVLAVILTDGLENSSREVDGESLRTMIAERERNGWTFIYMGANQDAWQTGSRMGLSGTASGSYVNFVSTDKGTRSAMSNVTSRGVAYLGDRGSFPAQFAAKASISEDGEESAENVAAKTS